MEQGLLIMEQEKINNIFKQDIMALKNGQVKMGEIFKAQALLNEQALIAVENIKKELEEWKAIIKSFQKYERYKVENVLSAKEDWEKATNPDDVRIHPGGGGGGKGGWGQNGN
ncbi:MAG: hypothetical protein ACK5QC_11505 [Bacteroidota bacterium]|jgi:hypothetical protein